MNFEEELQESCAFMEALGGSSRIHKAAKPKTTTTTTVTNAGGDNPLKRAKIAGGENGTQLFSIGISSSSMAASSGTETTDSEMLQTTATITTTTTTASANLIETIAKSAVSISSRSSRSIKCGDMRTRRSVLVASLVATVDVVVVVFLNDDDNDIDNEKAKQNSVVCSLSLCLEFQSKIKMRISKSNQIKHNLTKKQTKKHYYSVLVAIDYLRMQTTFVS